MSRDDPISPENTTNGQHRGGLGRGRRHRQDRVRSASLTELVGWAKQDDQDAWEELLGRFSPLVRKKIHDVDISQTLAEDAFQHTWMKLARSLHTIREPERLPGWLAVTARNEAYNMLRESWRVICWDGIEDDRDPPPEHQPDYHLIAQAHVHAVENALNKLTARQRAVVQLRYLDPEPPSYAQIAQQLEMRPGAIGPTLGRALVRMGAHPEIVALR